MKVPRLQVEQGLCLLFAGTHTEDGNVGEGTWALHDDVAVLTPCYLITFGNTTPIILVTAQSTACFMVIIATLVPGINSFDIRW